MLVEGAGTAMSGSAAQERIARRSLHEEVAVRLRDMIIEGTLAPGTKLNELLLCERLGVSRTPLREAIRTLASEGLIELIPGRGAVVRRLTAVDVIDMLEALKVIEPGAAALGCANADAAAIAAVEAMHARMLTLYAAGERLAYYKLNQDIHTALVALSGNATLVEVHTMLQARLKRIRFIGNREPDKWAGAVADHELIMAALRRRDAPALRAAIEAHLDHTWQRVRDVV
jgi:DNA-binding GntR family transcriptional regulator